MTILSPVFSGIKIMPELLEKAEKKEADLHLTRRICFVCTGNTCRSPMAAAVANAMAKSSKDGCAEGRLTAFSRGLYASNGAPISSGALHALKAYEIQSTPDNNYQHHIAATVSEADIVNSDLVIGMTPSHVMELIMRFPVFADKIIGMPFPISDPFGGSNAVYEKTLGEIVKGLELLLLGGKE